MNNQSKFPQKTMRWSCGTRLVEPARGLAECWTHADGAVLATWQRNVSLLSLRLDVCCERPQGSTVSTNGTGPVWSYKGAWMRLTKYFLLCLVFFYLPESFSEIENTNSTIKTGCKLTAKQDLVQISMLIIAEGQMLLLWEWHSKSHHIQIDVVTQHWMVTGYRHYNRQQILD